MKKNTIVTLADANYFPLLEELIDSIRALKKAIKLQFVFWMQDFYKNKKKN